MNLTPLQMRQQTFNRVFRGYDQEEVKAFLEIVAEEFERLNRENIELRDCQDGMQSELERYQNLERILQETLRTAQQTAEEVRENSKKEARLIVSEAEVCGNKAIEKARTFVHSIRSEILDLKNQRDFFLSQLRTLVRVQSDFLAQISFTDPDVVKASIFEEEEKSVQDQESQSEE